MGEAKRRAKALAPWLAYSKPISQARFDLYALGTRLSFARYAAIEVSWWASNDERLIGTVALDTTDGDFLWLILARDRGGRFRCVDVMASYSSEPRAEEALRVRLAKIVLYEDLDTYGDQDHETDEPEQPLDVPSDVDPDRLHPYFRILKEDPGKAPARQVVREIAPWLSSADPHFAREFRGEGFDQRLWEIYLWAVFKEMSLDVEFMEAPDFRCTGPGIDFTVEATTVGPSRSGPLASPPTIETGAQLQEFLADYMPLKFASPLNTKLYKENAKGERYWERDSTRGKPFVIAIADFHKRSDDRGPGPMVYTQSAIWQYLYGQRVYWDFEDDKLVIRPEEIQEHQFREKRVPSGYFDKPDAKYVSAVIFSNAGTIAKLDRMGVVCGFGAPGCLYIRVGFRYDPGPNAVIGQHFVEDVESAEYQERWAQELQVFHNPNALHPLPVHALPGATHHVYHADGLVRSNTPHDAVLSSVTWVVKPRSGGEAGSAGT